MRAQSYGSSVVQVVALVGAHVRQGKSERPRRREFGTVAGLDGAVRLRSNVTVNDGHFEDGSLKCSVDLKKPFPMTVTYTLTLDGDVVTGTAKAGPFPASKVTGERA